jgi:proliferating cell nuclear antigen PCNA
MVAKMVIEDGKNFMAMLKGLKNIFTELKFVVNKDGMKTAMMDPSHTMFLGLELPPDCFSEFECDGEVEFGLDLEKISKIKVKSKEELKLEVDDSELKFKLISGKAVKTYRIASVVINEELKEIPDIQFDSEVMINANVLQEYVDAISGVSESMKIRVLDDKVVFEANDSGVVNLSIEVDKEDNKILRLEKKTDGEIVGVFRAEYIKDILKILKISDYVELKLSKDAPLRIDANVFGVGCATFIIAPMIIEE